ncbi:MAG: DUF6249 domain-containing protein [Woeseiaceae bacterium]
MDGVWIPIIGFLALALVLSLFFWFRHKTRAEMQATIRTALEKGQELSPEIIDRLGTPKPRRDKDLRTSLVYFAIAVSLVGFGMGIPDDDEVLQIFMGFSAFPLSLGIAYLTMWLYSGRKS